MWHWQLTCAITDKRIPSDHDATQLLRFKHIQSRLARVVRIGLTEGLVVIEAESREHVVLDHLCTILISHTEDLRPHPDHHLLLVVCEEANHLGEGRASLNIDNNEVADGLWQQRK